MENEINIWKTWIGKEISKRSRKPFKSGNYSEIVEDLDINPYSGKIAFKVCDTFVDCYLCKLK